MILRNINIFKILDSFFAVFEIFLRRIRGWWFVAGFLLGTRQTLLETKDGGNTWVSRSISSAEDEDFNYRFNAISFKGKEGWIVGKPAILLHTSDSGDSWERIPLSAELPGDMVILYS